MDRTYISEVREHIGEAIKVQGFIENLRSSKAMAFIVLKDITGKLQITIEKEDHPDLVPVIDQLTGDSVITVVGKVMANDYVKMGGIEMIPDTIQIESIADPLPIVRKEIAATKKKKAVERSSIDQRIDYRWIDLRTDENQLMFKAQSVMVNAMRQFLLNKNFIEIHTPKLIATASESGADVFKVDYFDRDAYLAQSPQFYKQMAMASGFERIFEVGPVFRAEKSYTNKHTTEFTGFDLEFSYIHSFRDVMQMEEGLLKAALQAVKDAYGDNYLPSMQMDEQMMTDVYGVDMDNVEEFVAEGPMISAHVDTFIAVKAKEGKGEQVQQELQAYLDYVQENALQYPMNTAKVQAAQVVRHGDYVFYVLLGGYDERTDVTEEESVTFAKEQVQIGLDAIASFF